MNGKTREERVTDLETLAQTLAPLHEEMRGLKVRVGAVDPESPGQAERALRDFGLRATDSRPRTTSDYRPRTPGNAQLFLRGLGLRAGVVRLVEAPDRAR